MLLSGLHKHMATMHFKGFRMQGLHANKSQQTLVDIAKMYWGFDLLILVLHCPPAALMHHIARKRQKHFR